MLLAYVGGRGGEQTLQIEVCGDSATGLVLRVDDTEHLQIFSGHDLAGSGHHTPVAFALAGATCKEHRRLRQLHGPLHEGGPDPPGHIAQPVDLVLPHGALEACAERLACKRRTISSSILV